MKYLFSSSVTVFLLLSAIVFAQSSKSKEGKSLFGDLTARQIGPALMSGRINDLEIHPTNNKILYLGAAGGGVWKSNDGGATFNPIFDEHIQSIGTVTLDPNDPDKTIYVGTGETWTRNSVSYGNGLYKSTDGGSNWNKIGLENSERIASIIVNPSNSQEVYVAALGALWGDNEERGVFKSSDGGQTWEKILYVNPKTGCADLIMDPNDPSILYASMWEFRRTAWSFDSGGDNSALYKSIDGGKTWNKIHKGFPEGKLGRMGIALAPSNSNRLYTVIEAEQKEDKGLYSSADGGQSWEQLNNDFEITVRPFYFSRIVVDPKDENVIVKGGLSGSISRDGGKTFRSLGNMHSDIHDIVFSNIHSDIMYFGTDGGVYRSWNGGTTCEIVENLPLSQFYQISVDNKTPYNIYGGLQDNGSWYGPSSSPGGIEARDWNSIGAGDGFRVLKHSTKEIIYSEMQGAENIWRIDTENNLIKTIQPLPTDLHKKLRFNWNAPMALCASNPDRIYMGSQFLHQSDDMGNSWKIISPDLTTNDPTKQDQDNSGGLSMDNSGAENHTTIFTIAPSELDENIIWVGTDDGNVQVTQDGGKTWTNTVANIPGLPKNTWCYHIETSTIDKGTAYAVFDGHTANDKTPYAFKTTDFGKTWVNIISDDVEGVVRNIQVDYESSDLLFLGTELGLYITLNGGEKWYKFTNNMPAVATHYIALQKETNDLVLGTHGRGIIIIDDISPLRELNEATQKKTLHFFESKPTVIKETQNFSGNFGNETQFVGANKSSQAQIKYHLKKRHTFGKMTMAILNSEGDTLSELTPGKSKGINIVNWSFRKKQPKVAKGKTFSFGGFTTPVFPAGKYIAKISKGKQTFEHPFELVYDAKSTVSSKDRVFKHKTVNEIYEMIETLAYKVYILDAYLDYATSSQKKKLIKKLNALKETMVITTGDNYVGAAEPQLREKMTDIFQRIEQNYGAPTPDEIQNLVTIKIRFQSAVESLEKIIKKYKLKRMVPIKSLEEYLKS
ncbi:MAG: WD40/YVTN/BNR-like repeat-containing protein [Flavobacteriaceae bacterium]